VAHIFIVNVDAIKAIVFNNLDSVIDKVGSGCSVGDKVEVTSLGISPTTWRKASQDKYNVVTI
jgi:hypothetical protein